MTAAVEGAAVRIAALIAPKINLALYQNAIPVLRDLKIVNEADAPLEQLELSIASTPAFLRAKTWRIERVGAGATFHLTDLDVDLDGALLAGLQEAERASITLTLRDPNSEIAQTESDVRLLAPNEWGGAGSLPEILAAFVRPNDPAVETVLKKAAEILHASGKAPGLDGYQSGHRERAWEIVAAVWSAVSSLGIDYVVPPASFEQEGQKVRSPSHILDKRLGTCLDLALLFAAALEQAGLNPLLVLRRGHAFAGCWLANEDFSSAVIDDPQSLRKRLKLGEMVLFETTLVTHKPPARFRYACENAAEQVAESRDGEFELAIDVRRARMKRIRPLSERDAARVPSEAARDDTEPAVVLIDEAPPLPEVEILADSEVRDETPKGRLERWKRKLLDLSLRNRLLNFRATKQAVAIDCPEPGRLEDLLASGAEIKILPRPPIMEGEDPRSAAIHRTRHYEEAVREHALQALARNEVLVNLPADELEARLVELYRAAKAAIEEGGANTLYLAFGFLSWRRDDKADVKYRAPLILVPVSLRRRSVRSGVRLMIHDDEPRFNPTLLEMLRQDFRLTIPGLQGDLPTDDQGLDVAKIWQAVRAAVRDVKGWEVTEDVVLSTFSFSKYLMWKDLCDRTEQLKRNPVVRHLIETPRQPYGDGSGFPPPESLDRDLTPADIFCPLMADSSQLAAVMAAARGKDFVLIGPPGTGKSQTIANMIAQCLAEGKTVLFVSEKMAALDVVYRRLRAIGLGDFCLELHSNRARKVEVLEQLRRAWTAQGAQEIETWRQEADRLRRLRDDLNRFVRHLHRRHRNGHTPFRAMGLVVAGADRSIPHVALSWPAADAHDEAALERLRELAKRLEINAGEVGPVPENPFAGVARGEWSPKWQAEFSEAARAGAAAAGRIGEAARGFAATIGLAVVEPTHARLLALADVARLLLDRPAGNLGFGFAADAEDTLRELEAGLALVRKAQSTRGKLSRPYAREATSLDLAKLKAHWTEASGAWWLARLLGQRRVRKALAPHCGGDAPEDCGADLEMLQILRDLEKEISGQARLAGSVGRLWSGVDTDVEAAERAIDWIRRARGATGALTADLDAMLKVRQRIGRLLSEGTDLLAEEGPVGRAARGLVEAWDGLARALARITELADAALDQLFARGAADWPALIATRCEAWIGAAPRLHAWCGWCAARNDAEREGLLPLVQAIERGEVALGGVVECFETNYARWWLDLAIEDDPVLKGFVSAEQERKIEEFRKLDERLTELTKDLVRAKLCGNLPALDEKIRDPEWGVLSRELNKKRRHLPLRQLVTALPNALTRLTPCLLMSPLSIAQYLPADAKPFDVVIFDEASQIPVWDAVGAIARGKQVVVVGDPKQLPPTSFFDRTDEEADDEVVEVEDLESILDECLGANIPASNLRWHYRSRHESLIAFSNHRYYGGGLITFPSPVTQDRAVSYVHVAGGVYEKGGARVNQQEARAVVQAAVGYLKRPTFRSENLSLGIVTFNSEQQRLIEDLLDERRREDPSLEPFFAEDRLEPVFVKNLENVQGDERDIILFSVTYGPDIAGRVSMNFGPLNKQGGERRLNVAITRARRELKVFATLRADQIDLSRTTALGARDLKHFLEFAERGPRALAEAVSGPVGGHESPLEEAVAAALARRGWTVHPQIGVSGFRIDLGVVHPDAPGRYLAGVECDGATYHRSATARDRDKLREYVLAGLGWRILRTWSTDWWTDAATAAEKLHTRLTVLLEAERTASAGAALRSPESVPMQTKPVELDTGSGADAPVVTDRVDGEEREETTQARRYAGPVDLSDLEALLPDGPGTDRPVYVMADLREVAGGPQPERFLDDAYRPTLARMIAHVIEIEGPVKDEVLVRRIARAHGFQRAGSRIRDHVLGLVPRGYGRSREGSAVFFWPKGVEPGRCERFRRPNGDEARGVDEIALAELAALAREVAEAVDDRDSLLVAMARAIGLRRLHETTRERLVSACRVAGLIAPSAPR
jgi:hypothetical protein